MARLRRFYHCNLEPAYRRRPSPLHVACCVASRVHEALPENRALPV